MLGRSMGKQDHFAAAYGNLNVFTFKSDETVIVEPVLYREEVKKAIEKNLMLFYLQSKRDASEILKVLQSNTKEKRSNLRELKNLVQPLCEVFSDGVELSKFGEILHKGWEIKKNLTRHISSFEIDEYYRRGIEAGAIGGKLLGAGGGGFLLLYVEEVNQKAVLEELNELYFLPVKFDNGGTRITYYDQPTV